MDVFLRNFSLTGRADLEYVLDEAPPPHTLAQRVGLVEVPPPLLTCEEWEGVKVCSNTRKDSRLPCPICQEEFGLSKQVNNNPLTPEYKHRQSDILSIYTIQDIIPIPSHVK